MLSLVRPWTYWRANSTGDSQVPKKSASSPTITRARSNRWCGTTAAPNEVALAARIALADVASYTTCRKLGCCAPIRWISARADGLVSVRDRRTTWRRSLRAAWIALVT